MNYTDLIFNTAVPCEVYTRKAFYMKEKKKVSLGIQITQVSLEVTARNHVAITLQICSSILANLHAGGMYHV